MIIKKDRIPITHIIFIGIFPSSIKKIIYKLKGYFIGKKVKIGFGSVIIGDKVNIGEGTKIGFLSVIRAKNIDIGRFVFIGSLTFMDAEQIVIGEDTRIREQVYVGGIQNPDSLLKIGKRCLIMQMTYINPTKTVILGDDSAIGGHSLLFTHSSWLSQLEGYPVKFGPIKIGKKVWLPFRTFITSDVEIGDEVIVAPSCVITRNIPSKSMAYGDPLKILPNIYAKPVSDERKINIINEVFRNFLDYLKYHGFNIEDVEQDSYRLIQVKGRKKIHKIVVSDKLEFKSESIKLINTLLLIDSEFDEKEKILKKCEMVLSLKNMKRYGSSDIGEELIRYFSRYGIRFSRLD
ncbi:MAG: hypothetical protein ACFFC1_07625 [Promethearchaeota archaeon]